jgi:hypothetical protein
MDVMYSIVDAEEVSERYAGGLRKAPSPIGFGSLDLQEAIRELGGRATAKGSLLFALLRLIHKKH